MRKPKTDRSTPKG